ncbi:MAG: hypothetical protein Q9219_007249 [cf. Caloplaca sp. 3 TL-2023]
MATSNHITKVAVVGAGGNCGRFIAEALLKTGQHTITAITRPDSQSTLPLGVAVKKVDYSKLETIVDALRGQQALVITISGYAPIKEIEEKLVRAAGDAVATRKLIEELGKSSYLSLATGFWYEYSLTLANNYGFNFADRTIKFYDDGETKISTSTWPQVGRAVASLLSLPVTPEGSNKEACLESLRNKVIYINSFTISQKDMLASALRLTGTKEDDWKITKEPAEEVFATALRQIKEGKREAFTLFLYSRIFFPDGCRDFEHNKGTLNAILGLLKEDLDEATKVAIDR